MKRLYLSATDKKVTGLCGGIGEYLDFDPNLIRLGWIVLTVLSGVIPGVVAYLVASLILPKRPAEVKKLPTNLPEKS